MGVCNSEPSKPKPTRPDRGVKKARPPTQAKIILVGESDVGKTTLIRMYMQGQVDLKKEVTVVCNDFQVTIPIELENGVKHTVKANVWDTAGTEEFKSIAGMYYKDAHAAIILYAVDNKHSFEKVDYWEEQVHNYC